jgi:hypothetical protein
MAKLIADKVEIALARQTVRQQSDHLKFSKTILHG